MKGKMIKISGPNYFFFQLIQNVGRSGNLQRNPSRFGLLISTVSCQNQTEVIANCNTRIFSNAWDMCYHCCFNKMARKQFPIYCESVCSYHVTYAFQSESTLYSCLNVKELLARSRREIWSLSDCNWIRTHNHLVRKGTLNHLAKLTDLAKWLSVRLRTKWSWVLVQLHSLTAGRW